MAAPASGWESDFALSCSQCGGDDFLEIFPVPAGVFRSYDGGSRSSGRELLASVYACRQCGHLEWFVDQAELAARAARPGDSPD